jgi:hypothetical protein
MNLLAEVSDKVVSTGQVWAVMVVLAAVLGAIAFAWRSWSVLLLSVPLSAFGCVFTLSFLNDPIFGDAVLRENGWSWFASNITASVLPVVAVVVAVPCSRRSRRQRAGFEVVRPGRAPAE